MAIHPIVARDRDYLVSLRRHLHHHPELSMQEYETAKRIEEELAAIGIPTQRVGGTGVLGILRGKGGDGKKIVLRADTDALPIQDGKTVPYASCNPGVMHACGHDAHATALVGAARALKQLENELRGEVDFVFQPGEEYGKGAVLFLESGLLAGAERSFGIHVQSNLPVGQVAISSGPENASVDHFTIRVQGKRAHVSTPEKGVDALYAAAQIVVALQGIVTRLVAPTDPALIGVGVLRAGEGYNIVAQDAVIEGTVRCFSPETRALISRKIKETADNVAVTLGASAEVEIESFTCALINDPAVYAETVPVIEQVAGAENVRPKALSLGGDDMAEIIAKIPGVYAFVGSGSPAVPGSQAAHHTSEFDIDEDCLAIAASLYTQFALSQLGV